MSVSMAAAPATPVWKTVLLDALGFVLLIWSIPAAILILGTPIAFVIVLVQRILQL